MPNVVVVGAQWGDEGKGKVVDTLTQSADIVVRFGGGANAGHTLILGDRKLVVHLLPSGVAHPDKQCYLGAGMVIDPLGLLEEIQTCREWGLNPSSDRIGISYYAHVILDYHKQLDELRDQGASAIGTTRRGIGPCYEDKMARKGLQMWQLADPKSLRKGIERALERINPQLEYLGGEPFALDALMARYEQAGQALAPHLCDTSRAVHEAMGKGSMVLFEGAQGALLDIDYGTYPYVTSSNTIAGGACTGAGVGPTTIDQVTGVTKAYLTRVGNGPFPTELLDATGESLRDKGHEYGATTGRPRRCGWLDIPALRRAARVNGLTGLAVTKLDVLQSISPLRICTAYRLRDVVLDDLPPSVEDMAEIVPIYEEFEGFSEDIGHVREMAELPVNAQRYLDRIQALVGVPICLLSVGPRRDETIILDNPFGQR